MDVYDAGTVGSPTDIYDAGNTSTPPTDIYDSSFLMSSQSGNGVGMFTPVFGGVSSSEAINQGKRQVLHVKVGGTATTITVQIPGTQPYTNLPRDNQSSGSITNTDRVFQLPDLLADSSGTIVVLYSQSAGVTSALIQVA